MLSKDVIESLTSYLLTAVVNLIASHNTKIADLHLQNDVTAEALEAANEKLVSLLNIIAPYESFIAAKVPQLAPLVTLAQSYVEASKD